MQPSSFYIRTREDYETACAQARQNPEAFWAGIASAFRWSRSWDTVLQWDSERPEVRWFDGGRCNITVNALDRHAESCPERIALIWEPNEPAEAPVSLTYRQLLEEVKRFAGMLRGLGIRKGDRVCLYMGMVPELAIAMLACARIGAVHSVVFGGFSARSLSDRIQDAAAVCVITCDGAYRGAKQIPLKPVVDEALQQCPTVRQVLVCRRTGSEVAMVPGRDVWLHELNALSEDGGAEEMEAEDPLFILYTSGSTGKPKGVLHTTGGYMVYAGYSFANVFQYREGEVHFCTADAGWITGHSYLLYGPLLNGATTVMFEGIPTYPDAGRFWEIIDRHRVQIFYTAPTAIRSLMTMGDEWVSRHRLDSLRVLGTVGEPINEEAWNWYHDTVGKGRCPVVDTWWQTETGGIMISCLAGITPGKPAFAGLPLPGIEPVLLDEKGQTITGNGVSGNLCIAFPWPSLLRTVYGDHERYRTGYFSAYPGNYFTGDGAFRDADGYYRITGRVDDVLNVSGHRLGTAEIEEAINACPGVAESAVVGFPHPIKGEGIYAFVITGPEATEDAAALRARIAETVSLHIGAIARPERIQLVAALPKTRSGKIMRRILRKIAAGGNDFGDTSTLLDPGCVAAIAEGRIIH